MMGNYAGLIQKKLGDIATIVRGSSPRPKGDPRYYGGKVPRLMIADVTRDGKYVTPCIDFLTDDGAKKSREMKKGDLVISISGTVAVPAILNVDACIHDGFMGFRNISGEVNIEFLYYKILSIREKLIKEATDGGIYVNLTTEVVKNFSIMIPELNEQEKIVEILSIWDLAIEKQEQLIEKKKEFKKGLLQRLLSGDVRFKGFKDEWKTVRLGDYLIKHSEKSEFNSQYPVLTSSRRGIFLQSDYYSGNDVASEDTTGYNVVPRGYFTYRHMSDDLIFKFNINDIVDKGIVSTLYPVFTVKNMDSYFLRVKLNEGEEFKRFALAQKQGGSRTYMYFSKLETLKLKIPTIDEQLKISEVLKLVDKEIELLQKELEELKLQKKGLMQRLLTGEVRVNV